MRLVQLVRRQKGEAPVKSKADETSWEGVDRGLFDALRDLRRELATQRQVPAYVVFSDNTLRELARNRPTTLERMHMVYGVGEAKLARFRRALPRSAHRLLPGQWSGHRRDGGAGAHREERPPGLRLATRLTIAFDLYREGLIVEDVMHRMSLSRSTVVDYLAQYIRAEKPASIATWVPDALYQRVVAAARQHGVERLKPLFIALGRRWVTIRSGWWWRICRQERPTLLRSRFEKPVEHAAQASAHLLALRAQF